MMSDDEVRRMIADMTADLRANPPKLEDVPADQRPMLAAQWQDDAHQAYSDSWFAARVGELDEARRLVAEASWSDLLSRKVHGLIIGPGTRLGRAEHVSGDRPGPIQRGT